MTTTETSVILGAAVIDDVMGLFVLAFFALHAARPEFNLLALRLRSLTGYSSSFPRRRNTS